MTSFRDTREVVVQCYDEGLVDDDEFILLYEANISKNPEFPYEEYERFDLEEMDDAECKAEFRFAKRDIPILAEALGIPEKFICHQGTRSEGIEGPCMLLKRLTYPCRYSDLIPRFGRPVPVLSMISNTVLDFIYNELGDKITQWDNSLLNPVNLEVYAAAISDKGAALDNCISSIDRVIMPPVSNFPYETTLKFKNMPQF